ncbi:MAG: hypothetical protein M0D53_12445 [Flavobacterium sp. JAD_PAG50586_2]|nr:MAG: hypothetical protein M0D53_12445 [Flavobacterium sp. JAD_PAG50586_2]
MIVLLPAVLVFVLFVFLFFREIKLDHQRFLEADRLADEHILREVERFVKEMNKKNSLPADE